MAALCGEWDRFGNNQEGLVAKLPQLLYKNFFTRKPNPFTINIAPRMKSLVLRTLAIERFSNQPLMVCAALAAGG